MDFLLSLNNTNNDDSMSMSSSGTYKLTYSNNDETKQIFLSNNGGTELNILTDTDTHKFNWKQTIVNNNGNTILAININGNTYISYDGGNNFNLINALTNVNAYSITMTDDGRGLAVGCYQDYIYIRPKYSQSWYTYTPLGILKNAIVKYNYTGSCFAIMSYNSKLNNFILNYYNNNTINGWVNVSCETNVFTMSCNDNSIIYVAGTNDIIQIYTDTNKISILDNPSSIPLTIINANNIGSDITATNGINIYKSINYGKTFSEQKSHSVINETTNHELDLETICTLNSSLFSSNQVTNEVYNYSTIGSNSDVIEDIINYGDPVIETNITIEVNVTTGVVTLPIIGIDGSVFIDWGDGSTVIPETSDLPTYMYESPGTYTIQISGDFTQFGSSNVSSDYNTGLQIFTYNSNISRLTSLSNAFAYVYTDFVVDFSNNTSNVTNMNSMFYNCKYFNSSLSNMDTSSVTDMSYMFYNAARFNQIVTDIDTTLVINMDYMFYNSQNFNQDLSGLLIPNLSSAVNMLANSGLSTANYDALLNSFYNQALLSELMSIDYQLFPSIILGVGNIKYSPAGQSAHNNLVTQFGWEISDGGFAYCFNKGTKIVILENNEEIYKNIEELSEGTLVKTYSCGYKKIINIVKGVFKNDISNFNKCMYRMKKSDDMVEDLLITGSHSILVDTLSEEERKNMMKVFGKLKMIDGKYLLLSSLSNKLEKIKNKDTYEYYNIKLEGNECGYGIYANGVLCESLSDYIK